MAFLRKQFPNTFEIIDKKRSAKLAEEEAKARAIEAERQAIKKAEDMHFIEFYMQGANQTESFSFMLKPKPLYTRMCHKTLQEKLKLQNALNEKVDLVQTEFVRQKTQVREFVRQRTTVKTRKSDKSKAGASTRASTAWA